MTTTVRIRGESYTITRRRLITSGRNYGRTLYYLAGADGATYVAMARGELRANSRVTPTDRS